MTRRSWPLSLGEWNQVPGHPDWIYGLVVRHDDGSVTFCVGERDFGGRTITGIHAGPYRHIGTRVLMGDPRLSWQEAADAAILALVESGPVVGPALADGPPTRSGRPS